MHLAQKFSSCRWIHKYQNSVPLRVCVVEGGAGGGGGGGGVCRMSIVRNAQVTLWNLRNAHVTLSNLRND